MSMIVHVFYEIIKIFLRFLRDVSEGFKTILPSCPKFKFKDRARRRQSVGRKLFDDFSFDDDDDETSSLTDTALTDAEAPVLIDPDHYQMHRPKLEDRFGTLRFRVEFTRGVLLVTVIDAWDLPPMDADGKADPYVEISLRPGSRKFTTGIKYNCLNPTFNETAELPLKAEEIGDRDLVLKVLDNDYPQQDELIGVVRLPLSGLDLNFSSRQYTCLILHDKDASTRSPGNRRMSSADAAKLNLKISQQAQELYDNDVRVKTLEDRLQDLKEEHSALQSHRILLEMEMEQVRYEGGDVGSRDELDAAANAATQSAPVSKGSSPMISRPGEEPQRDEKFYRLLTHLKTTLVQKDDEILKLRAHLKDLKPRLELLASRNGQIEIGLAFFHISSKLRIDVFSAANLRAVNLYGDHSDPFAKVKVFWQRKGGKTQVWKFSTKTVWRSINPIWNEDFVFPEEVTAADLPHLHLEITVLDRGRLRSAQPLGKVRIGPNQAQDGQHWEEMLKHHGQVVKMMHALKEV